MMQIGDLANRVGVTARTIRYYEELGLIEPEERTGGGFRLYSDAQLRRLKIIQSLKELGFDLERIRDLFLLKTQPCNGRRISHFAHRAFAVSTGRDRCSNIALSEDDAKK